MNIDLDEKLDKQSYIIDVAKSSSYQNQTEEYFEKYGQWRSKKNNPYGYDFVKDSREHSYIDGKGYVDDGPDKAERIALSNCCKLVGFLMIVMQAITIIQMLVLPLVSENYVAFSSHIFNDLENPPFVVVCVSCAFSILRLLVPIILFIFIAKMPLAVVMPKGEKRDLNISISGVSFMLMALIIGRYANMLLAKLFSYIHVDFANFNMIDTKDPKSIIVYALTEYVILSILIEVLFRGFILQLFRQFGDMFALVVSCLLNVLFYGDATSMGHIMITSIVVGLFTLRSGSIYTAIAMRVSARLVTFFMSMGLNFVDPKIVGLVDAVISALIIAFSLITYSKLMTNSNCDFNITDSYTHLNSKTKFITMLSSKELCIWLIMVFITMVFNIRFL